MTSCARVERGLRHGHARDGVEDDDWQDFYGPNAGYIAELYERYLRDPNSVDAADRERFARWSEPPDRRRVSTGRPCRRAPRRPRAPPLTPRRARGA